MTGETDAEFLDNMEQWVIGSLVFKRGHRERLFALARRGAAVQWREPTDAECANAAMSYRHDYGLLSDDMRKAMRHEARHWLYSWWKNIDMPLPPSPSGEPSDG